MRKMKIQITVPLEKLDKTIKFFDKNKIMMDKTEMEDGKRTRKCLTPAQKKEAIAQGKKGNVAEVATNHGIAPSTLHRWLRGGKEGLR